MGKSKSLFDLSVKLSVLGHAHKFVTANSETSGNEEFDGTVWGLVDDGVDDSFVGEKTGKYYVKLGFDQETKDYLSGEGYSQFMEIFEGALLTFKEADTDSEPESIKYFRNEEDLDSEFSNLESAEGGRKNEELENVPDDNGDGEITFDDYIWQLVDEVGCDESVGEETDGVGWYGLFKFDNDLIEQIKEAGFEIDDIGGAIVFFREGAEGEEDEESISFYSASDLDAAWEATKEEQASYNEDDAE